MPRKSQTKAPARDLPSREKLLAYLSGKPSATGVKPSPRVTKREIARAFRVKGEAQGRTEIADARP